MYVYIYIYIYIFIYNLNIYVYSKWTKVFEHPLKILKDRKFSQFLKSACSLEAN